MDDAQLRTLSALRDQRRTIASIARRLKISRQGLHAYLGRHGGWPCPKCGYEDPAGRIVVPNTCLRCQLKEMLTDPELPLPRRCETCERETPTPRSRYCQDCAHKRRLGTIHRIQQDQDRELAATATRRFKAWRADEDLLLLTPDLTLLEIAKLLGRTRLACVNRRRLLKGAT